MGQQVQGWIDDLKKLKLFNGLGERIMTEEEVIELLRILTDIVSGKTVCTLDRKEKELINILQNKGYISIGTTGTIKGIK